MLRTSIEERKHRSSANSNNKKIEVFATFMIRLVLLLAMLVALSSTLSFHPPLDYNNSPIISPLRLSVSHVSVNQFLLSCGVLKKVIKSFYSKANPIQLCNSIAKRIVCVGGLHVSSLEMDFRENKPTVCINSILFFIYLLKEFVYFFICRIIAVVPTTEELKQFGYNQASLNHVLNGVI